MVAQALACETPAFSRRPFPSIEQILPPLLVALAQQPHQMPAGVQTERPRLPRQLHPRFLRRAVALPVVARIAARHQILPIGFARARPRHHVVQRQLRRRQRGAAAPRGPASTPTKAACDGSTGTCSGLASECSCAKAPASGAGCAGIPAVESRSAASPHCAPSGCAAWIPPPPTPPPSTPAPARAAPHKC